jgi:hypothetical protein
MPVKRPVPDDEFASVSMDVFNAVDEYAVPTLVTTASRVPGELVPIPTFPLASLYNCPEPMLMTPVPPVRVPV